MAYVYTSQLISAWDSWAVSVEGLDGLGYFEFSFNAPSGAVCGVSEAGIAEHYSKIRHGFYYEQAQYQIIELGAVRTAKVICSPETRFRIERHSSGIRYLVDGVVVHTTPEGPATEGQDLFLYASIYAYGEKILDSLLVLLAGEEELEASLPGYVSYSATEAVEALADLVLPALDIFIVTEDGIYSQRNLPAYIGFSSSDDVAMIQANLPALDNASSLTDAGVWFWTELPALRAMASTDDVCLVDARLPAVSGFAQQSDIMPNILSVDGVLPAFTCYCEASDSVEVNATFSALIGAGIAISNGEEEDQTIMLSDLLALIGGGDVGASNYLLVRVPAPRFLWFGMCNFISEDAFRLDGWISGGQTGGWIEAEAFSLDGEMTAGGWIVSAITSGLQGEMDGSVVAKGRMAAAAFSLAGELLAGGLMDSVLTTITGQMDASSEYLARIAGQVFSVEGRVDATAEFRGTIQAAVFSLGGDATGMTFVNGTMFGAPFFIFGDLDGETQTDGHIEGEVLALAGKLAAGAAPVGEISVAAFSIVGQLSCIALGGQAQCVTMKYSRY